MNEECTLLYQLLMLEKPANDEDFNPKRAKSNYLKIIRKVHADKCKLATAHELSIAVIAAWRVLNNRESREAYNRLGQYGLREETHNWERYPDLISIILSELEPRQQVL